MISFSSSPSNAKVRTAFFKACALDKFRKPQILLNETYRHICCGFVKPENCRPVSYAHLYVYKRQTLNIPLLPMKLIAVVYVVLIA